MASASIASWDVLVPASAYLGNLASNQVATPVYPGGVVNYKAFIPGDSALAAMGWTGQPYRVLVAHQAQGTGEFTGANPGAQCLVADFPAQKLGYGASADGSAAVLSSAWPTIVVFPQIVPDWTGTGSSGGIRKQRAYWMIMEACLDDVFRRYNCDRSRLYCTSASSGGVALLGYLYGRATRPQHFKYDFAAFVGVVTWAGGAIRIDFPDVPDAWLPTSNLTLLDTVMMPDIARAVADMGTSCWFYNSTLDGTIPPATYASLHAQMSVVYPITATTTTASPKERTDRVGGGGKLHLTEYTGAGAPSHNGSYDLAWSGDVADAAMSPTQEPWSWMFQQAFVPKPAKRNDVLFMQRARR